MALPPPPKNTLNSSNLSDVGQAFESWQTDHGRWGVYGRTDRRYPCTCYDPDTQGSSLAVLCPLCLGTGFQTRFERLKAHVSLDVRKAYSTSSGISPAYLGEVDSMGGVAYVRTQSYPHRLDLFFEVEWDLPYDRVGMYGTPTRLATGWKLKRITPVIMGSQGSVDLWLCGLEQHSYQHEFLESILRGLGPALHDPANYADGSPYEDRLYGGLPGTRYPVHNTPNFGGNNPPLPR